MFGQRIDRAREAMADRGVDVLLLSVGADLPYFCGYEAMPLERLTMLVVPRDGDVHLVVPYLEAPRVVERPEVFNLITWRDSEDPIPRVVDLVGGAATAARVPSPGGRPADPPPSLRGQGGRRHWPAVDRGSTVVPRPDRTPPEGHCRLGRRHGRAR